MSATTSPAAVERVPPPARVPWRPSAATAAPTVGLVILGTWLVSRNGGYDGADWNAMGLVAIALLGAGVLALGSAWPRPLRAVLLAFGAFCAWSYASIAWAAVPDSAWQAANRVTLYGLVLALVTGRRWRRREAAGVVAVLVVCLTGLAVAVLLRPGDGPGLFIGGRLSAPTGYPNADAELWLIGLWPALSLASAVPRRSIGRPLWMAVATLFAEVSLLSQSRGAVLATVACGGAFVLLSRSRARAVSGLGTVAGACVLAWGPLSAAGAARTGGDLARAFAGARLAIGLSCLGVGVLVLAADALAPAAARLLGRVRPRPAVTLADRRRLALGLSSVTLVLVALAGQPGGWAQARWHDFKDSGYSRVDSGQTRLAGGFGSNRYDFYRVALDQWLAHPVVGIGADNFRAPYLAARRSPEAPRYPHSLPLAVLSELGLIGAVLFAGFLGLAARGLGGPVRRGPPVALGAGLGFAGWIVHASVDWLWEFPGLGVLAFMLLGIALGSRGRDGPPASRAARPRPVVLAGAAVLGAALVASFALQLLAQRAIAAGDQAAAADPVAAMADFERASSMDTVEADSLVSKAILAARLDRPAVALDALRRAIVRVPGDWFAHFELGVVDAALGDRPDARAELDRARRLDPGQSTITAAAALVAAGRPLSPGAIAQELAAPFNRRLSATGG